MVEDERRVVVDVPSYKGPDRREAEIVISQCGCHPKHQRILDDHDKEIDDLKVQIENRRKEVNNKMVKDKDWGEREHQGMWEGIKSKVPNHLFYLFVSVFAVLYIIGIVAVYTGMHKIDKSLSTELSGIKTEVKVMSTTLKYMD